MTATPRGDRVWERERRWLGYAGLLPFLGCTFVLFTADAATRGVAADVLRHYAAVIASFLGAVHWGVATSEPGGAGHARLRWGVTPALAAWVLLMLPAAFAFAGFAALFTLILIVDRYLLPLLDDRYRRMRMHLSLIVILTLLLAAGAAP